MIREKTRHWNEIDVLYTVGIVLVLVGHSHSSDWSQFENTVLVRVIRFIYTFHMPLFFFISGFLFQNSRRVEIDGLGKWIKDKFIRLLVPYFFWSLIAIVPKYYLENRSIAGLGHAVIDLAINPRAGVWGHFWFLPVLFLTYAIFGVAKVLIRNEKCSVYGGFAVSVIYYILPVTTGVLGLADLRSSLVFFSVGMIVNRSRPLLEKISGGVWVLLEASLLRAPDACVRIVLRPELSESHGWFTGGTCDDLCLLVGGNDD